MVNRILVSGFTIRVFQIGRGRPAPDDRARQVPLPLAQLGADQRRGQGLCPLPHVRRPFQEGHLRGGPAAPMAQVTYIFVT